MQHETLHNTNPYSDVTHKIIV